MNALILTVVLISFLSLSGCQPKTEPEKNAVESAEFFKDMNNAPAQEAQGESQQKKQTMQPGQATTDQTSVTMAPEKPTIQDIQMALKNAQLYQGKVDGVLGPKTRKAIEDFQQQNALKVDGKAGRETWSKLKSYFGVPSSESAGTDHAAVTQQTDASSGIKD